MKENYEKIKIIVRLIIKKKEKINSRNLKNQNTLSELEFE